VTGEIKDRNCGTPAILTCGRLLRSSSHVSSDVTAAEPVAETKKDNVRPHFCCQTTSAWNAVPACLFRANAWSSTTPCEACGRRAIQRLRSGRAWKLILDRVSPAPAKWWSRAPAIEIMKQFLRQETQVMTPFSLTLWCTKTRLLPSMQTLVSWHCNLLLTTQS
jgi:hypothetical protein